MKLKTAEWLVGFGLWSGAWALFNLISGLFFELQISALGVDATNESFVSLAGTPIIGGAAVIIFASAFTNKAYSKLLVLFSIFSAAFLYFEFVYWVTYVLLCEGAECLTSLSYQSPFESVLRFNWQALASECGGYLAGWSLLVLFAAPETAGRRALSGLMKWLQVDTIMYARFWRWWFSLPLWTYAPAIKIGLRNLWIGICCIAAVEYVFSGISTLLGAFGHILGATSTESDAGLAAVYAYTFTLWAVVSFAIGRKSIESGVQAKFFWLLGAGLVINLFDVAYSFGELWTADWITMEVQTIYGVVYLPASIVLISLFVFLGMRQASSR